MGFEELKYAIDEGQALEPITQEEAQVSTDDSVEDLHALKIVLQDVTVAERYVNSKALPTDWNRIDELYRAYVEPRTWPNSDKPRSHLGMPLVLEAIENILSQIHMAFFSESQPFELNAVGKTTANAVRAAAKVLNWALKMAGAKEEFRKLLKSILMYGQGVGKWGWQTGSHTTTSYKRDENGKITKHPETRELNIPTFEFVELRHLLVDPALRNHDIRLGKFVIQQAFITANDLEDLADDPTYKNVPSREELARILAEGTSEPTEDSMRGLKAESYRQLQAEREDKESSADPMEQPLELLEYTSNERVITVLQRKIVIRNDENEFGRINYVSCSLVDVLGAWYGFGVGKLLEGEQRFQTGVVNAWIDALSLSLNPMWHRKKGMGAMSQNIASSPGRVVNDDGELAPLPTINTSPEALGALESSETRATRRVAANFGNNMPTQAMRTKAGVDDFTQGVEVRLQYFIDEYAELVFVPVLESFLQLCKDHLQPEDIKNILTDQDGQDYEGDKLEIYNGQYGIEVLSSTKLAARRALLAVLPQIMNMIMAEAVQNSLLVQKKKVDYVELLKTALELTRFPTQDLIVDATDEDIQRAQMLNPAAIQAKGRIDLENQQHQNDMDLEEEKATGRAGVQVVRHILDQSKQPEPAGTAPLADALAGGPQPGQQPPAPPQQPEGSQGPPVPKQI